MKEALAIALRIGKLVVGSLLVLVGIAGIFLPILQGILFILLGLGIISTEWAPAREARESLEQWWRERRAGKDRDPSDGSDALAESSDEPRNPGGCDELQPD